MSASQYSIAKAKAQFATLVLRAEMGQDVVLTRNGKPVAKLTGFGGMPVEYGDLRSLRIGDDLSLPESVIDDFLAR